jgi:prolyl-tRNA synthetase
VKGTMITMKIDKLVGIRFKQRPSDCEIDSHALMLRGGYMKSVANGIFSSYTPLTKIIRKIEKIICDEMNKIDGQEVVFPIVLPASLYENTEIHEELGDNLFRFNDSNKNPFVFGLTYEEAAIHIAKGYGNSYSSYPFMIYQIQTKFCDELRTKGGLIKAREFIMKDAYSFHAAQDDLNNYYEKCIKAYKNIFNRVGITEAIPVISDFRIKDNISHDFIILNPVGEDLVAMCVECGYYATVESAECIVENIIDDFSDDLKLEYTPNTIKIEDVCELFKFPKNKICKTVVYQKPDGSYIIVFIRSDLDINENKLKNYIKCNIQPAIIAEDSNLCAGYIGPYKLDNSSNKHIILFDNSLRGAKNFICGSNQTEYHYTGFDILRDIGNVEYYDLAEIIDGGICPKCNKKTISISNGIKIGSISQIGAKYTKIMEMQYIDNNGQSNYPLMGRYKIDIGKLAASVCELHHDEYGPIWPISISPWQVHLCAVRSDDNEVKNISDNLYNDLIQNRIEVIYDDRNISAGAMFADADLLGVPLRIIISPRNIKENCCEIVSRDKTLSIKQTLESSKNKIIELVKSMILQSNCP